MYMCMARTTGPVHTPRPNSSGLKSVFQKLRFRDGLVRTVGLTAEIKLRFRDGLVWTVGLTVEIKQRFRDGLVWTAGLTVEIKLRFRDGLVWTVGLTVEIKLRFQISLKVLGKLNAIECTCLLIRIFSAKLRHVVVVP